jgi:type 1 fimbriae regulatory protein FimB/type 1 fimbriae regulatory protein FimE
MSAIPRKRSEKSRGTPKRLKSSDVRAREYLTEDEVERLIIAARKHEKNGSRDALMIRMAFRHGLRASEVVDLQWDQIDLKQGTILVKRLRNGEQSLQALDPEELEALKKMPTKSTFVFLGQRGPLFVDAFHKLVEKAGAAAKLGFPVHPPMLRHAREFDVANQ